MLGLSFLLMLVSVVSYLRIKDIKMLFLVAAFSLFFVKGIFLLAEVAHFCKRYFLARRSCPSKFDFDSV